MTKIQLRRDTAANWASNNPTPAAGEPCYETDTGKLKIGDGSTAYNNLAYQGGGSTPDNMVTTDTAQTITGLKNFQPAYSADSSGVKAGLAVGKLKIGTDNAISPNPVLSGDNISIVSPTGKPIAVFANPERIVFGNDTSEMSLICSARTVNLQAWGSASYVGNLAIGIDTLKYTSATGETTDLLAGGSGASIDDTTTSTDKVWSSDKVNTELGNKQDKLPSNETGYTINVNGTSVAGGTVYFGRVSGASLAPHAKADSSTYVLNINGYSTRGSGYTMYDTILKTNSFKYGDRTNQYEVVNKSPANNTYMAHMAMPSDKYIDLELGASGTTYTAPADGYFILTGSLPSSSDIGHVTLINRLNTTSGTDGKFTVRCYGVGKASVGTGLYASVPAKTGDNVVASWAGSATGTILRFIYAVGSEPTE